MALVSGVDCSTQSTKVVVVDADTGSVVRNGTAPHPESTEVEPEAWWNAFSASSTGLLDDVLAISFAGQQHGMVLLDEAGAVVRPALLWNDTRSATAAHDLVDELGGPQRWARAVGSVPVASFTVSKLRWVAEHEPDIVSRAASVLLPHDWLTFQVTGRERLVTDRGDASGTGYWSPKLGQYRPDLIELAFGRALDVPAVLGSAAIAGRSETGQLVGVGTGDNMAAALGLGVEPGQVIVSIGTSGTVFIVNDQPACDPSGLVAGFADATGRFLPLVCTLNAARVLEATTAMLGTTLTGLDDLALSGPTGADGLVFIPYLDGERTPNLPDAHGALLGMTRRNMDPKCIARASIEGMLCSLADGLDALRSQNIEISRALLIGGGSHSRAVQAIAASIFGIPVSVPAPAEYVALGAARQAAWALQGTQDPPPWRVDHGGVASEPDSLGPAIRSHFSDLRKALYRI
jgi:xylulokinase